jgi:hypothetical protein
VRGGRKEVEAMEAVLDRGKIAPHDSKQYVALEFLNFTNPVQRKDAVHRKKVRKHAMKQSWQARKDHARSAILPGDRQTRLLARPPGPGCACKGLGHLENGGTRKRCPHYGGGESRESSLRHTEPYPDRLEASRQEERGMVTQPGDHGRTDELPALELENQRRLGAGNRDPFPSFPILMWQNNGLIEMLLQHCK